jgi:hypothetical protein
VFDKFSQHFLGFPLDLHEIGQAARIVYSFGILPLLQGILKIYLMARLAPIEKS